MTTKLANARPRKHFFFEMFTRDISLEDCILDLIDNSIDGLVRARNVNVLASLLTVGPEVVDPKSLPTIKVTYSENEFVIEDTCGGIDQNYAIEEAFNFGHAAGVTGGALGVYGIGLKRAIFKIGNHFQMESRTEESGFTVDINVKQWAEKDDTLDDWRIPLTLTEGAKSQAGAGTTIRITNLRPEVKMRMNDGVLAQRLHTTISQTYGLFIARHVLITLNGTPIDAFSIPIGVSDVVQPAHDEFQDGQVVVKIFASLAARGPTGEWAAERAGWYVMCNGRIVTAADKTDLTGWGVLGSPNFHSGKFRGFVGVVLFQSTNTLSLPWTTTKRGLNRESSVYQNARNRMKGVAKPILSFLDSMYKPDSPEEAFGREIANQVKPMSLASAASTVQSTFTVRLPQRRALRTTIRVQYDAEKSDIERVRKHAKRPSWSASQVGKHTFEYYVKTECPE